MHAAKTQIFLHIQQKHAGASTRFCTHHCSTTAARTTSPASTPSTGSGKGKPVFVKLGVCAAAQRLPHPGQATTLCGKHTTATAHRSSKVPRPKDNQRRELRKPVIPPWPLTKHINLNAQLRLPTSFPTNSLISFGASNFALQMRIAQPKCAGPGATKIVHHLIKSKSRLCLDTSFKNFHQCIYSWMPISRNRTDKAC